MSRKFRAGRGGGWSSRRSRPMSKSNGRSFRRVSALTLLSIFKVSPRIRKSRSGRRVRPLKASTIRTRRAELQAAARMALKVGIPIDKLTSLAVLMSPEVAEKILDAYWQKNGEEPKLFTIDFAARFLGIAKETKCLGDADCERLDGIRGTFEHHRKEGLTEKNVDLPQNVLTPGVWGRVVKLPFALMAEARRQRHAPVRAAVTAQMAVAIAILSVRSSASCEPNGY